MPTFPNPPWSDAESQLILAPGLSPVADYVLEKELGRGGSAEVWKALGPGGFHVALKVIRLDDTDLNVEVRSLETMKEIRHPHLLDMFGAWRRGRHLIIAMALGEKTLLDRLLECARRDLPGIPFDELIEYMREAAKGIDHLNSLGIQHRDIKPHNLLLVGGGVKVADFGLAKVLAHTVSQHSGSMTPAYAAPEVLHGRTSQYSDQYALAASYCLLRGNQLPFDGSAAEIMAGHMMRAPDLTMLPEAERDIVGRALAKDPTARWPNCKAFVDALAAVGNRAAAPDPAARNMPSRQTLPTMQRPQAADTAIEPPIHSQTTRIVATPVPQPKQHLRSLGKFSGAAIGVVLLVALGMWLGKDRSSDGNSNSPAWTDRSERKDSRGSRRDAAADKIKDFSAREPLQDKDRVSTKNADKIGSRDSSAEVKKKDSSAASATGSQTDAVKTPHVHNGVRPAELPPTIKNSIDMRLMLIAAGRFRMGSPLGEAERKPDEEQHDVEITQPFYLAANEVTQQEYERVMGDNPSEFSPTGRSKDKVAKLDTRRFPVEQVSWHDAVAFCQKLTNLPDERRHKRIYRLPTEAEWEYACRGGTRESTPFYYGSSLSSTDANFNGKHPYGGAAVGPELGRPTVVGSYVSNGFGLYDMHGNIYEWCSDWYEEKYARDVVDPKGPASGSERVLRGGNWAWNGRMCRSAERGKAEPVVTLGFIGFRVVLEAGSAKR